jgi:alpha-N-acetylglucosamine transferase
LYTDSFPAEGHAALDARGIPKRRVPYLLPTVPKEYTNDVRFYDCWSKLTPFSLVEYERVVQLDSDMLVLQNMDELMHLPLDPPQLAGTGERVFAACHACLCNPLNKRHYPEDWYPSPSLFVFHHGELIDGVLRIPPNCAYTTQHAHPSAQSAGAPSTAGLGVANGGLVVANPCKAIYDRIIAQLATSAISAYDFADQSLLSDVFRARWVPLPYTYNALKTMRWTGVHDAIWRDESVKNLHYILNPKPWDRVEDEESGKGQEDPSHVWWRAFTEERVEEERRKGVDDRF